MPACDLEKWVEKLMRTINARLPVVQELLRHRGPGTAGQLGAGRDGEEE
jgi:hypothetical protein